MTDAAVREAVADHPLWYHTIELRSGVVTPGWFDLRGVIGELPWPDVTGKRCLDIATYDGHLAFELERRGAAEVVATDIVDHHLWDHLPRERHGAIQYLEAVGGKKGRGFEIARDALGSRVDRRFINVYDLDPVDIGTFDVVTCGSLLLHLRDPLRALERIRSVCTGTFLSVEAIDPVASLLHRKRPMLWLNGDDAQWLVPNGAAHVHMLHVAGFDVQRTTRPKPEIGRASCRERVYVLV